MIEGEKYQARMIHRRRGRPRTASDALREAKYRDENGKYQLTNGLKHWHERIVDFMLMNPEAKIVDVARHFRYTPQWIGQLVNTDAFKEYYTERMRANQNVLQTQIVHKMQGVAIKSLDKIAQKLDAPDTGFTQAREAADLTLKALGFTSNGAGVSVNVSNPGNGTVMVGVSSDAVEAARAKIHQRMKENSEDHQHDPENYQYVTASVNLQKDGVEDAVVLPPKEETDETS